jgi:hypothetical protein
VPQQKARHPSSTQQRTLNLAALAERSALVRRNLVNHLRSVVAMATAKVLASVVASHAARTHIDD